MYYDMELAFSLVSKLTFRKEILSSKRLRCKTLLQDKNCEVYGEFL